MPTPALAVGLSGTAFGFGAAACADLQRQRGEHQITALLHFQRSFGGGGILDFPLPFPFGTA